MTLMRRCRHASRNGSRCGADEDDVIRSVPAVSVIRDRYVRSALVLPALALLIGAAGAEPVAFYRDDGTRIDAHWFPAPGAAGPRPAIVAMHGCGGLYRRDGRTFDARYPEYVEHLNLAGYHVLLPDSFGSRGSGPICSVRNGERTITVETRRDDVIAAVTWLAARNDVDARRIALLGWSHGAMTTLTAINAARRHSAQPLAGAVVFYPGCRALLNQPFRLEIPLLMLLGERDDWTPPARCVQLAEQTRASQPTADFTVKVYRDSHHGFDGARPVRFRTDVPNGADRSGAHAGGNPVARVQSRRELDLFLVRIFK
jgi:dienelactone hydrolase